MCCDGFCDGFLRGRGILPSAVIDAIQRQILHHGSMLRHNPGIDFTDHRFLCFHAPTLKLLDLPADKVDRFIDQLVQFLDLRFKIGIRRHKSFLDLNSPVVHGLFQLTQACHRPFCFRLGFCGKHHPLVLLHFCRKGCLDLFRVGLDTSVFLLY